MTIEQIKDKILKFTASFVKINEILTGLYTAIATSISYALTEVEGLPNADWTGKGLIKNCEENGIINTTRSEANLQTDLVNRFEINLKRGTEAGILDDVSKLLNVNAVDLTINFYSFANCGFIVGREVLSDPSMIVGSNKLIVVEYTLKILDETAIPILDEDGVVIIGTDDKNYLNLRRAEIEELIPVDTNLIMVE